MPRDRSAHGRKEVFIGGNYDNMAVLREIAKYVDDAGFEPKLAIDEYRDLPPEKIHEKDIDLACSCDYAIFEETFPAGELMELERYTMDATTGEKAKNLREKVKTLVVYQIRGTKTPGPFQLTSMVTSLVKERKFKDITLFGYPTFKALSSFIRGVLGHPLEYPNECMLVLSVGTLGKPGLRKDEVKLLNNVRAKRILFSGWNFGKCEDEARKYEIDAHAIIAEACTLYVREAGDWSNGIELYKSGNDKENKIEDEAFKTLNSLILDEVYFTINDAVLFSQGDKASIDYYVNPSLPRENDFRTLQKSEHEKADANSFSNYLIKKCQVSKNQINVKNGDYLELPDDADNRYYIVRFNAMHRTFRPYRLKFKRDQKRIGIELLNTENLNFERFEETDRYERLKAIVERAKLSPRGQRFKKFVNKAKEHPKPENKWDQVTPQADGSIDIFRQTKEKSWEKALEHFGDLSWYNEETPIIYISRGTENDKPFIIEQYSNPKRNFCAFGLSGMIESDELKIAGVIIKKNVGEILNIIKPAAK